MANQTKAGNQPTAGIHAFAVWAVEPAQQAFRVAALDDLQQAINNFPGSPALSPEEVEFCEGWLYLARKEMAVDNEGDLDKALVEKANRHIADGQIQVMNG